MRFKKIIAAFEAATIPLAEELISHIFFSFKLKGVVCDIPLEEPDEGFGTNTLDPPEENAIIGFLPDMDTSDLTIEKICTELEGLSHMGIRVVPRIEIVDEKDWADAWKEYFEVTRITDRIVVKPEWKPYTPAPEEIIIHIDPGMAFGTGTHPTTAMCLELLESHLQQGQTLLDVGCGSGILMIAGAKLGAAAITGIDTDPMAVEISRENLIKNELSPADFLLKATTLDRLPEDRFELITANIIAQVIVEIMGDIKARLALEGTAVLSGIILERKADILAAMDRHDLVPINEKIQGEWVALSIRHAG